MNRVARLSAKTFRQIESSGKVPRYSVLSLMIGLKFSAYSHTKTKKSRSGREIGICR